MENIVKTELSRVNIENENCPEDEKLVAISAGSCHLLALGESGKVYTDGCNSEGQLGIETLNDFYFNPKARKENTYGTLDTKKVVDVSAGTYFSLFLTDEGTIYGTGSNFYGQLGNPTNNDSRDFFCDLLEASPVFDGKVVSVSGGYCHSLFLTDKGKVYAAGLNYSGELGISTNFDTNNKVPTPTQVTDGIGDKKIVAVSAGHDRSLFLTDEGEVYTCGDNFFGTLGIEGEENDGNIHVPTQITGGLENKKVVAIAAGELQSYFLTDEGEVYFVGTIKVPGGWCVIATPVLIEGTEGKKIVAISVSDTHCLLLADDGTVYGQGNNDCKQLGFRSAKDVEYEDAAKQITDCIANEKVVAIAAGHDFSLFLTDESEIYVCGNTNAFIGD